MPHGEIHKKKLKKNLAIAAMVFLWCALIWVVTMIKVANAQDYNPPLKNNYVGKNFSGMDVKPTPVDRKGDFYNGRYQWQQGIQSINQQWTDDYYSKADDRQKAWQDNEAKRLDHLGKIVETRDGWTQAWLDKGDERLRTETATLKQRAAQRDKLMTRPRTWWDEWEQNQERKRDW